MAILTLIAASLVVAPVPKEAQFGDWTVACDNGRHCEALALPPEDGSEDWTFYVARDARPLAAPSIEANPAFGEWQGEQRPVRLTIDGRRTEFGFDKEGRLVGDGIAMLAAIAAAKRVKVVDLKGMELGTVRTAGASAALRWIDDRQKRAGTVTAIVARGKLSASKVPPPPALPRIVQPQASSKLPKNLSPADIKAIQGLAADYCNPELADPRTYRLDSRHTVGVVGCMLGAYQGASLIVVIDENGKWRPAEIEQPEPPHEYSEPFDAYFLTAGDYDPEDRTLWMAAKGRGLADCGSSASWVWDGKMFRLASYHSLGVCRGAPPGTWFSRWQTANKPLKPETE